MSSVFTPADTTRFLLIGGCGRSGTTFIQERLGACNEISGILDFESKLFAEPASIPDLFDFYVYSYTQSRFDWMANIFVSSVERNFALLPESNEVAPITKDSAVAAAREFVGHLYRVRTGSLNLADAFRRYATPFLYGVLQPEPARWVLEKTPHNALQFGRVLNVYPKSRLIHVVRDPRRIAESLARQDWFTGSFEDAVIWVRLYYEQYWRLRSSSGGKNDRELTIRLEDCVNSPRVISQRIGEFLDIEDTQIRFDGDIVLPNQGFRNLSDDQLHFANSQLFPTIEAFGYNLEL